MLLGSWLPVALATACTPPVSPPPGPGGAISADNLRRAAAYSAAHDGVSLLVMVDGKIVFEDYPNGGGPHRIHELASGTKSFSCALAVAAVADGLLSLDEPVAATLTEWKTDPRKSRITVRHLLSLTSGLAPGDELLVVPTYAEAIGAPALYEPGERFEYGPVPFQVFGELMRRKLEGKGQSPVDYLRERVFDPIGLRVGRWRQGPDGNPRLPSGALLTAREWAKYGELIRLGGVWEGKTVLPTEILEECFQGTPQNPAYGLTWWLNREVPLELRGAIRQLALGADPWGVREIPSDLVFAAGAGKQRLYISRSRKLVVVRQSDRILAALLGRGRSGFSDAEFLRLLFGSGGS